MPFAALLRRVTGSSPAAPHSKTTTPETLFPTVSHEEVDECNYDCNACPESGFGRAFDKIGIDTNDVVWGAVKAYSTHVIVATGETDWIRDVEEIKGSVMQKLNDQKKLVTNGRMMISASNIHPPQQYYSVGELDDRPTSAILVPAFIVVENLAPKLVGEFIDGYVNKGPTTEDPLNATSHVESNKSGESNDHIDIELTSKMAETVIADSEVELPLQTGRLQSRPYPHDFMILICSHRRRDARCGISAPILRKEFEKHLRPLGLWRDVTDKRTGGASVVFINHVGGHKYSANILIYRKSDSQGIWLARVNPRHIPDIVKHTIVDGKIVHPETHLRGGWNHAAGLVSW